MFHFTAPGLVLRLTLADRALQIGNLFALCVALLRQLLDGPLVLSGLGLQGDLRLLALRGRGRRWGGREGGKEKSKWGRDEFESKASATE